VHVTVVPAVQTPTLHVSFESHWFPSLQVVPSAAVGLEHCPVDGLHVPTAWHWSDAVHVTWLPAAHTPAWHVSPRSHAFPSLHAIPFETAVCVHVPALHASAVHGFPSSQDPEHPPSDPKLSSHVTTEPVFIAICAAAIAPVKLDVLTETSAFVATTMARTCTLEFKVRLCDEW
jgi:hypothetical protein